MPQLIPAVLGDYDDANTISLSLFFFSPTILNFTHISSFTRQNYNFLPLLTDCLFVCLFVLQALQHHTLEIHCKPEYHRFLIGRQGANIRRVRDQFGAHVIFPQKSSDDDSETVTIIGPKEKAEAAKAHLEKLIKDLVRTMK